MIVPAAALLSGLLQFAFVYLGDTTDKLSYALVAGAALRWIFRFSVTSLQLRVIVTFTFRLDPCALCLVKVAKRRHGGVPLIGG